MLPQRAARTKTAQYEIFVQFLEQHLKTNPQKLKADERDLADDWLALVVQLNQFEPAREAMDWTMIMRNWRYALNKKVRDLKEFFAKEPNGHAPRTMRMSQLDLQAVSLFGEYDIEDIRRGLLASECRFDHFLDDSYADYKIPKSTQEQYEFYIETLERNLAEGRVDFGQRFGLSDELCEELNKLGPPKSRYDWQSIFRNYRYRLKTKWRSQERCSQRYNAGEPIPHGLRMTPFELRAVKVFERLASANPFFRDEDGGFQVPMHLDAAAVDAKKARSPRTSQRQYDVYIEFLERAQASSLSEAELECQWKDLVVTLNQLGFARTSDAWRVIFRDMRYRLMKKQRRFEDFVQTGGNEQSLPVAAQLSEFEKRAIAAMQGVKIDLTSVPQQQCVLLDHLDGDEDFTRRMLSEGSESDAKWRDLVRKLNETDPKRTSFEWKQWLRAWKDDVTNKGWRMLPLTGIEERAFRIFRNIGDTDAKAAVRMPCRSCAEEKAFKDLKDILSETLTCNGRIFDLGETFKLCTGVEVTAADGLSHLICHACIERLRSAMSFRVEAQKATEKLSAALLEEISQADEESGFENTLQNIKIETYEVDDDAEETTNDSSTHPPAKKVKISPIFEEVFSEFIVPPGPKSAKRRFEGQGREKGSDEETSGDGERKEATGCDTGGNSASGGETNSYQDPPHLDPLSVDKTGRDYSAPSWSSQLSKLVENVCYPSQ